ncbi:hypothetical protein APHCRT_0859 [Anaplasma phagocytophilum str. CRT53-1]|uniref:Uncharacterized protein n=1 Tax=Anaplasma phagocytophilum str. CRT53-1 TaxID=1359157 RepID=A0A0F3PZU0_ANAPH|nr:hypothetical protein APHCRT_0859 [Anaplasma phagocytophilum str. CRT53-1]KJV87106.1 hypothetical protein APHNYW_0750 [Anaplasma phagocytophilum str. ApNYW]
MYTSCNSGIFLLSVGKVFRHHLVVPVVCVGHFYNNLIFLTLSFISLSS